MNIDEVRRANLRRLAEQRGGNAPLARLLGYSGPTFVTQIAGPSPSRPLSEKNARRFEKTLGLPERWFDMEHGDAAVPAPPAPPAASAPPDSEQVGKALRFLLEALSEENLQLAPAKTSDVLVLLLADMAEHGGEVRQDYLKKLVKLVK